MPLDVLTETYRGLGKVGKSKEYLCGACIVQAEIELRAFLDKSKYFTECENPF